jgi:Fic family protein
VAFQQPFRANTKYQNCVFLSLKCVKLKISKLLFPVSMARIRIPPSLTGLMDNVPSNLYPLMQKYGLTDPKGRYLHWDEFKWRVDKGDDEQLAWFATKLSRFMNRRPLANLQAEGDQHFSYCDPNSLYALLHEIDKMTGGGHSVGESSFVSSSENNRYLVRTLMMEEAITSSQLEGASTTRQVAKEMLRNGSPPKDKSQQMIFNNFLLLKKAVEVKDEDLSIELILDLHRVATIGAIENQAVSGEFRKDNQIIVSDLYNETVHQPPSWETIEDRIQGLCDFANVSHEVNSNIFIHPIIKAIILHFMIGYIHPFGDGNGRTARALFYWYALKSGYWLFEYISISRFIQEKRGDYDKAFIYVETDEFDLTYFLYHQLYIIRKAVQSLHEHLERKRKEYYDFLSWIDNNSVARRLKGVQLEILKEAVREPGREFTVKQVSIDFGVTENTARSHLKGLVDADLLVAAKSRNGKTVRYLAPAKLRDKLRG